MFHHTTCFSSFTVIYKNLSINLDLQHWLRKTFTHSNSFYTLGFRLKTFSSPNNNYGDSFSSDNYTFNFLYLDFYFIAQSWLHFVPLYFFVKTVNLCIFNYCDSTNVDEIWLVLIPMFHVIFFLYILLELSLIYFT